MICPHCKREFVNEGARKGGRTKGDCKRRSAEVMRANVKVRWDKYRAKKAAEAAALAAK